MTSGSAFDPDPWATPREFFLFLLRDDGAGLLEMGPPVYVK